MVMDQQSSMEIAGDLDAADFGIRRARRLWFPPVWAGLLVVAAALFQLTDATRDYKNVAVQVASIATLVGWTVWWLGSGPGLPGRRWLVAVLGWGAIWVCFYWCIDLINDGDNRIVGWRFQWTPLPDELLEVPDGVAHPTDTWATSPRDYPRFLGTGPWAEVKDVTLNPAWREAPPVEIWRREVGAGWSGFAVVDKFAVTQEQRGDQELVVCYRVKTGKIVWTHRDEAVYLPQGYAAGLGGRGPRATPTIHDGRIFTQGAAGRVNCLNARTGARIWTYDPIAQQGIQPILWGQSGSPLVVADLGLVVVNVGAPADLPEDSDYEASLVAFRVATGKVAWSAGSRITSYASPILTTLAGVRQIVQINQDFVTAHDPATGAVLWEHPWPGSSSSNASCSQPVPVGEDRLLLTKGYGVGASLLEIRADSAGRLEAQPVWTPGIKPVLKTKLGNIVVRDGFAYGLDGVLLQCVELATGRSAWKARRRPPYGHGQIMLVGDVILILSETGELALVNCTPERYEELAAVRVFNEDDVTWNNPAFSAPYLLIRNAREAACYALKLGGAEGSTPKNQITSASHLRRITGFSSDSQ